MAMQPNAMFGSHAAKKGDKEPASAKVRVIMKNKMKIKESRKPRAI
jgi:hypothetical protein